MIATIPTDNLEYPALPPAIAELLRRLDDPALSCREFQELVGRDREFDLKDRLLKIAGYPEYAGQELQSVAQAFFQIGRQQLCNTILFAAIERLHDDRDEVQSFLWTHALLTGLAAHIIAQCLRTPTHEMIFVTGILHDIGKLVLYRQYPSFYLQFMKEAQRRRARLHEYEALTRPELRHAEIGHEFAARWGLPGFIGESILHHHELEAEPPDGLRWPTPALITSLASLMANAIAAEDAHPSWDAVADRACARHLNFSAYFIRLIGQRIRDQFKALYPGRLDGRPKSAHCPLYTNAYEREVNHERICA